VSDKLQPRNIYISFNNNSVVPIDCLVFIFYSDEFVVNVETGIIDKLKKIEEKFKKIQKS
jgi:hypothetical protein